MENAALEAPAHLPSRPASRLAIASRTLSEIAGCIFAGWAAAAVLASVIQGRDLAGTLHELPEAFFWITLMTFGAPILLIFLTSLAGLITGILARKQTTRRDEDYESRRVATAGIWMAAIELAALTLPSCFFGCALWALGGLMN